MRKFVNIIQNEIARLRGRVFFLHCYANVNSQIFTFGVSSHPRRNELTMPGGF